MHMSGRSVVRLLWGARFGRAFIRGALFAAPLIFVAAAGAQQPDPPKPSDTPASSGDATPAPAPSPDLKTKLGGRTPKDVPLIDPCKSAHPPSYCNVKD
jgi:hypothetical protein